MDRAIAECEKILKYARDQKTPIFHIVHHGKANSPLFDPNGENVRIVEALKPLDGEIIITKSFPNSFAGTELHDCLQRVSMKNLIVVGFMTHMCVSTTVRAGLDLGYQSTVIANACATRPLTGFDGSLIPADVVHASSLAALRDRFAAVVTSVDEVR